jgi:hypothetical protein
VPRILTDLKFWGFSICLLWIMIVTVMIFKDPAAAHAPR